MYKRLQFSIKNFEQRNIRKVILCSKFFIDYEKDISKIIYKFLNNSSNFHNDMIYYGCKKKLVIIKKFTKKT